MMHRAARTVLKCLVALADLYGRVGRRGGGWRRVHRTAATLSCRKLGLVDVVEVRVCPLVLADRPRHRKVLHEPRRQHPEEQRDGGRPSKPRQAPQILGVQQAEHLAGTSRAPRARRRSPPCTAVGPRDGVAAASEHHGKTSSTGRARRRMPGDGGQRSKRRTPAGLAFPPSQGNHRRTRRELSFIIFSCALAWAWSISLNLGWPGAAATESRRPSRDGGRGENRAAEVPPSRSET